MFKSRPSRRSHCVGKTVVLAEVAVGSASDEDNPCEALPRINTAFNLAADQMPAAANVSLFTDSERGMVKFCYAKHFQGKAVKKELKFGPKM